MRQPEVQAIGEMGQEKELMEGLGSLHHQVAWLPKKTLARSPGMFFSLKCCSFNWVLCSTFSHTPNPFCFFSYFSD
jgi:hypothetical protein